MPSGYQLHWFVIASSIILLNSSSRSTAQITQQPNRILPAPGIEISPEDRKALERELEEARSELKLVASHELAPDVEIFVKALDFALRHDEFYRPQDVKMARELVAENVATRVKQLTSGQSPWKRAHGRLVRGYYSSIDGSVQPYGLVIAEDVDFDKPAKLYVWLHGRGDKQTDLHFIRERLTRDGEIKPPGAIVLHPFGRHCLGFKSAGEVDVLDAIRHVQSQYNIDPNRIVLMGFSMGGAGAWHLGAHYTDHFAGISPGAGFAETARYQRLRPENFPPKYEQALWGTYDVPCYVRNLFNRPVVAYSGELDKQIQAARVMEQAFQEHGRKLTHLIGPGTEHRYHPETLKELLRQIAEAIEKGRPANPPTVSLQTRTLRYNQVDWVEALRLEEHWQDSRIDAEIDQRQLQVSTKNILALRLSPAIPLDGIMINIDGESVEIPSEFADEHVSLIRDGKWRIGAKQEIESGLLKRPGLQGPIDDAFLEPFLVVVPSGKAASSTIQSWVEEELAWFENRWRSVFRGELRRKIDRDVNDEDFEKYHLIVWGTPESNAILERVANSSQVDLPITWSNNQLTIAGTEKRSFDSSHHLPVMVYPNPLNPQRYLVINSGPTFREAHDRTNSLQNPKLPDWAIVDLREPRSSSAPGRIADAGFFDERWQVK